MAETGQFATLWKKLAERLRLQVEFIARRLAPGRRLRPRSKQRLRADGSARDQGGLRRAQRDLDRRDDAHPADPRRDRPRRPSGAADGRHDLVAGLDRLPPRRMGRRRHGRRLAEGPDAAAGTVVQRDQRQGARRVRATRSCRAPTGTGRRCSRPTRTATSRTRRRPTCCTACTRRSTMLFDRRPAAGLRAPRPPRRGHAPRGARLGTRDPVREPGRIQLVADRDPAARGPQRRSLSARSCSTASTCRWARDWARSAARSSASAISASSTT